MNIENDVYSSQGFGKSSGFGSNPALVIIDFMFGFVAEENFGGGNIPEAIAVTQKLLKFARSKGWPIVHTRVVFSDDSSDKNIFTQKVPGLLEFTESSYLSQIVDVLKPVKNEFVLCKRLPSAFVNTDLAAWLTSKHVDNVVIAGCTTSGCVRASVVDAMSHGFKVTVAEDCVGDRAIGPHKANLFDMQQKYADVLKADDIIQHFLVMQ